VVLATNYDEMAPEYALMDKHQQHDSIVLRSDGAVDQAIFTVRSSRSTGNVESLRNSETSFTKYSGGARVKVFLKRDRVTWS
jgi:hypothetical protein